MPLTNTHNVRSAKLLFHIPNAGILHGLAGYFEASLYGGIELSIHPDRKDRSSKNMLSWFPLFFPFKVRSNPFYFESYERLILRYPYRSRSTCQASLSCMSHYGGSRTSGRCGTSGTRKLSCPYLHQPLGRASILPAEDILARAR